MESKLSNLETETIGSLPVTGEAAKNLFGELTNPNSVVGSIGSVSPPVVTAQLVPAPNGGCRPIDGNTGKMSTSPFSTRPC